MMARNYINVGGTLVSRLILFGRGPEAPPTFLI
jgi:hypothetical protein